jgi:hypothetical protein
MPTNLYHLTAIKLEIGSVVQPGNWGRILRRYQRLAANGTTVGDPWILARELVFEMVRREKFENKPSRWDSAFCCTSLEEAREYQQKNDLAKLNIIYEVSPMDDQAPHHRGPLGALDWLPAGGIFVENYEALAAIYWSGQGDGPQEYVTKSRLKVLDICD